MITVSSILTAMHARKLTLKNHNPQMYQELEEDLRQVQSEIMNAVNDGKLEVNLNYRLNGYVKSCLLSDGYHVLTHRHEGDVISWDERYSTFERFSDLLK